MRPHSLNFSLPSALLLLPALVSAVTLDCKHIRVDGQSFDLSELGGPRSVSLIEETPPSLTNTTFTVDICNPLQRTKGVPKADECAGGTRVCGIEYDYNLADNSSTIRKVIPIAGEYASSNGRSLDPVLTRLKNSAAHGDADREGVRVELKGGRYPFDKSSGQQQRAIIEFVCDAERTGLEGVGADSREKEEDNEKEETEGLLSVREEGDKKDGDDKKDEKDGKDEGDKSGDDKEQDSSLQLISYKLEGEGDRQIEVLRLNWRTKYACEGQTEHKPSDNGSSHWGFFTWFLIIVFMVVAAYLIFGSWLNYNRYGARGWDLLPHGDTIRDFPYAFMDWCKSLVSTVQTGSRGGYSAV
ncbi:hypothetical protein AAFC00_003080 [Neodothiora populina]|uniref:Autophagy-related protein 27 n=1 Tax=Neodothiora populina TaxID=2781224 RepID=A0ABR3P970_9PEZI